MICVGRHSAFIVTHALSPPSLDRSSLRKPRFDPNTWRQYSRLVLLKRVFFLFPRMAIRKSSVHSFQGCGYFLTSSWWSISCCTVFLLEQNQLSLNSRMLHFAWQKSRRNGKWLSWWVKRSSPTRAGGGGGGSFNPVIDSCHSSLRRFSRFCACFHWNWGNGVFGPYGVLR